MYGNVRPQYARVASTVGLQVLEEVRMLQLAGAHPNVVTMQAFFEDEDAFYIVMDLCKGGELYHRLADKVCAFSIREQSRGNARVEPGEADRG